VLLRNGPVIAVVALVVAKVRLEVAELAFLQKAAQRPDILGAVREAGANGA
jgi:hypothetical protein